MNDQISYEELEDQWQAAGSDLAYDNDGSLEPWYAGSLVEQLDKRDAQIASQIDFGVYQIRGLS